MFIPDMKEDLLKDNYTIEEIVLDSESEKLITNMLSNHSGISVNHVKEMFGIPIDITDDKLCEEENCLIIFKLKRNVPTE